MALPRLYVGTRKGLFILEPRSAGWSIAETAFLAENVSMLLVDPRDGAEYVALDHGHFGSKLHRRRPGEEWAEIAAPTYPEKPETEEDNNPMTGQPNEWKLRMIWALEPGGAEQPGKLWCGTLPGGLFVSEDHGDHWSLVRSLWDMPDRKKWFGGGADQPGIHSICVDPRDADTLRVGVSCGGVWESTDGGGSWQSRCQGMRAEYMPPEQAYEPSAQDPHRLVQCPGDGDHYWVQHHNGIFRSTDNCQLWTEISEAGPAVFGFAVVVHPLDPLTAWFVPAKKDEHRIPVDGKVVVTRTRDGGRSFDVLTAGLPQQHAYDLVYRHAMDIAPGGEALAFGSTTGSLWTSTDEGDSWQTVSNHLPPIHCLRFVP